MTKLSSLFFVAVFAATASQCHAAYEAFMKVTAAKQGQLKGAGHSKSGYIPIVKFSMTVEAKVSEKKPITVTIEAGDSAEFTKALKGNEVLKEVAIKVVQAAGNGKLRIVEIVTLTNAVISSMNLTLDANGTAHDTINFAYQKIAVNQPTSSPPVATDFWKQ